MTDTALPLSRFKVLDTVLDGGEHLVGREVQSIHRSVSGGQTHALITQQVCKLSNQ